MIGFKLLSLTASAEVRSGAPVGKGGCGLCERKVKADLLPEEKVRGIPDMQKRGSSVCINFVAVTCSVLGVLNPTTGALGHNVGSCLVVLIAALLYDRKFE